MEGYAMFPCLFSIYMDDVIKEVRAEVVILGFTLILYIKYNTFLTRSCGDGGVFKQLKRNADKGIVNEFHMFV